MRAIIFTLLLLIVNLSFSQINTPRVSPVSQVKQMVGLTEVEIEYSRPSMRGREVFGNLVPFGKIWRTGADSSTKISFDTDVIISGKTIQSGTYSVFSIPNKDDWKIIFYSDIDLWGVPKDWSENKVVFSSTFPTKKLENKNPTETFTISFNNLTNNDVNMNISWENTSVDVKMNVPTRRIVENEIDQAINGRINSSGTRIKNSGGPSASIYYSAAVYYRQENIKLKTALEWINKAIDMTESPKFWQFRQQSLIMAANNKFADAVDAAKKSLNLAIEADNQDYIKMNRESISEWSKKL